MTFVSRLPSCSLTNDASGTLTSLRIFADTVELIDLSHNQFTGRIPSELGQLERSAIINLDENDFERCRKLIHLAIRIFLIFVPHAQIFPGAAKPLLCSGV